MVVGWPVNESNIKNLNIKEQILLVKSHIYLPSHLSYTLDSTCEVKEVAEKVLIAVVGFMRLVFALPLDLFRSLS